MDEKLYGLLVNEINKGIVSLDHDKEQLIEELKKYQDKPELPEKKEFQNNISEIDNELEQKRMEIATIKTRNEIMAQIKEEQAKNEAEYKKLLKEKKECEDKISMVLDPKGVLDGIVSVPEEMMQEYKKDLERINLSLENLDKLKIKHQKDMDENLAVIEDVLKKYKIREKYKTEIGEEQDINASKTEQKKETTVPPTEKVIKSDDLKEQTETIVVEGPQKSDNGPHKETDASDVLASIDKALEELNSPKAPNSGVAPKHQVVTTAEPVKKKESQAQKDNTPVKPSQTLEEPNEGAISVEPNEFFKDSNSEPYRKAKEYLPNKIQQIKCFISNGKLFYTIVGKNEEDKQFITSIEAVPKRLTRQEKRSLAKKMDKYGIENIDPQIYRILREDSLFRNTGLLIDYMEQINRLSSIDNNAKEDDMKIYYDLQDLRSAKLGFLQKSQIKSIARRNYLEGIAEYIKPKSRFKTFMDKIKQKLLPAGNGNRENKYEEIKKDEIITKQGEDMPREDKIYSTYKHLSKEDGFDFDKFCEYMELTPEERKDLESYEKVNSSAKAFHRGIKNPVEYKAPSEQQQSDGKQTEKEHE